MRIGIDCRLWNQTGVGRYTRNLISHLAEIDKTNSYILFFRDEEFNNVELPGENFEKHKAAMRWHTIKEQIYLPFLLQRYKLDVVHFPYFSVPTHYQGKFIVTIHDLILDHFDTGEASTLPWIVYKAKRLAYKYVIHTTAAKAKKIIAVSHATKKEIIDHIHINSNKIDVIYEGVGQEISYDKLQISKNSTISVVRDVPYFLYVGNAYPHKNLARLIEAFTLLVEERPEELKLVLAGKEDYFYKNLREFVKQIGIEKSVIFCGEVTDEELSLLYKNAQALVLPSLMEGFGLPGLEAMKVQCLVMASAIPAFKEIYKDAAIYFDPMDIVTIKKQLVYVLSLDKKMRETYSKAGIARSKMFSFETMAKETLAIYEAVASNNEQIER